MLYLLRQDQSYQIVSPEPLLAFKMRYSLFAYPVSPTPIMTTLGQKGAVLSPHLKTKNICSSFVTWRLTICDDMTYEHIIDGTKIMRPQF